MLLGSYRRISKAAAAQVTKQTVYRYFPSKKLLFTTLVQNEQKAEEWLVTSPIAVAKAD
jgi:AcrR family transcriptional regulator